MPERIQRSRAKGWRMPEGAVYVGRPSRWGNPFAVGVNYYFGDPTYLVDGALVDWPVPTAGGVGPRPYGGRVVTAETGDVLRWFGPWVASMLAAHPTYLDPLRGRDLACWCPLDLPCHADVLLEMANAAHVHVYPRNPDGTDAPCTTCGRAMPEGRP